MIETAIRNLVENSLAAVARDGGRVEVALESEADHVVVIVDDDGPGLGAATESLFVPFHRGSGASADSALRSAGVGLGLAIARRIAVSHGGTLTASISPQGGARFRLAIPRSKE